jgi:hypothetical protein
MALGRAGNQRRYKAEPSFSKIGSGRGHKWCAASTATRLCNKTQGWTEGTTLGSGDGGAINPNGVVAGRERRRLVFRLPGRNPVGVGAGRLHFSLAGMGRVGKRRASALTLRETFQFLNTCRRCVSKA